MFAGYSVVVIKIEYSYTDTDNGQSYVQQRTIDGLCFDKQEAEALIAKLESFDDGSVEREIIDI